MSQPDYSSNSQTTNFARASRVILGPCRNVLCAILDKKINPSVLLNTVKRLIKEGKKLPFTLDRIEGKNYSDFDITLLYSLFRNIDKLVTPHAQGWGKDPGKKDRSMSANIERIRIIRNKYAHSSEYSIADKEFKHLWKEIVQIVQELEKDLGTTVYLDGVKEIETCTMDPEESKMCIEKFVLLNERVDAVSEELKQMKKSVVPSNVQEEYDDVVLKWEEGDAVFFKTHNFQTMFDQVKNQPYVTFVGAPGSGKSATARHIALKLKKEEGYAILPITDLNKLEDYCDPESPQVFVIDDVVGMLGFETEKFNLLKRYKEKIIKPKMQNTKILMTCREIIFKNKSVKGSFLDKDMHVIQFQSNQNRLTDDDKRCLLRNYKLAPNLIPSNRMSETSNMFPFLCKMYSNRKLNDFMFFIRPIPFILDQLNEMQKETIIKYASLVLLMMSENKLSKEDFKKEDNENTFAQKKIKVLRKCKVGTTTDTFEITCALKEMEGTYTQARGPLFCFIHDSLYEIVAYHFGRQFPNMMLKYMNLRYISNYIKFDRHGAAKIVNENEEDKANKGNEHNQTDYEIDLHLTLQESFLPKFADRLFKEMGNRLSYDVFSALRDSSVYHAFIDTIAEKSYADIKTVFFLKHNVDVETMLGELEFHFMKNGVFSSRYNILFRERTGINWKICKRAISFVVGLGHDVILQHIIDKMLKSNGSTNDLFFIPSNDEKEGGNVNNQENAENDFSVTEFTELNKTSRRFRKSGLCCVRNTNTENLDDEYTTLANAKHSDSVSKDIDTSLEPDIVNQWRLLCLGCLSANCNTVKILLKHVNKAVIDNLSDLARIHNNDMMEINPLVIALDFGCLNIARELIKAGAELNRSKLLHSLWNRPSMDAMMLFLKAGTHERTEDYSRKSSFDDLFQNGDDVNVYEKLKMMLLPKCCDKEFKQKKTPLMIACQNESHSTAEALLKAGADVNFGNEHETLVAVACKRGSIDLIEELSKAGAYIDPKDIDFSNFEFECKYHSLKFVEFAKKMIKAGAAVNMNNGFSKLLTVACETKNLSVVEMLLNEGADVNFEYENETPLTCALKEYIFRRSPEVDKDMFGIIELLLKKKATVNMKTTGNKTPLIVACKISKPETVGKLIEAGAVVNLEAGNETPLIVACTNGKSETIRILIEAGAIVNQEAGNRTPLIAACKRGNNDAIKELIKAEADVNLSAGDETPLIVACKGWTTDALKELIKAGADINLKVGDKRPLMIAFEDKNANAVKKLIKAGAKFNLKVGNETPLMIACQHRYTEVVEEIIKAELDSNNEAQDKPSQIDVCDETNMNVIDGFEEVETIIYSELRHDSQRMAACLRRHLNIAEMLYKAGGSVNSKSWNSALLTSRCLMGHLRKAEHLIKLGAISNQKEVGCAAIKAACRIGDLRLLKELRKFEADIDFRDGNETPLMIACVHWQIEIVQELVKAKADVNLEVEHETLLTFLCQKYVPFDIIEELLKAEADVNKKAGDKTPLIIVCQSGKIDIVELLLKYNADVNLGAGEEMPLICACLKKHLKVVKELLKKGANVNYKDTAGNTTLTAAISNFSIKHLQLVKTLVKAGANVNLGNRENKPLDLACKGGHIRLTATLIKAGAKVNRKAKEESLLAVACKKGYIGIVKELIQAGACVNHGCGGKTPLQIAYEQKSMKIVELLVKGKASCNRKVGLISPITVACFVGNTEKVEHLIKDGAALDVIDNTEKTPLTAACQKGSLSLVKELIKAGANVDFKDKYNTPLTTACLWGHLDIVKELIKAGSDVNRIDVFHTPLTIACFWEEIDIVKELIATGADVNLQDKANTPLIIACLKQNLKIVMKLIEAKADVNQKAEAGTPLTAASERDIVQILIDAGADVNLGVEI